jgi:RNA polymerase sigma-70 factor (ECF subfamily)
VTPDEFDELYAASAPRLVAQMHALTGDRAEAQDVVQEAFVRAWQHRGRLDASGAPEAWVRTTARRLAVSRWRRTRTSRLAWLRAAGSAGAGTTAPPADPLDPALVSALRALPYPQREAIVMHHLADLSVQHISAALGVPEGTVKARLSRGRQALATELSASTLSEGRHV